MNVIKLDAFYLKKLCLWQPEIKLTSTFTEPIVEKKMKLFINKSLYLIAKNFKNVPKHY